MTENIVTKENTLASLKQSATFSMSRGSRELFHTNFLAFILEAEGGGYVQEVKQRIIKSFFDEPYPKDVICFRERSNLDLIMIPALDEIAEGSQVVVIEAKLKSIPTKDQLKKYTDKLNSKIDLELFEAVELKSDGQAILVEKLKLSAVYGLSFYSKPRERFKPEKKINIKLKKILLAPDSFQNEVDHWHFKSWEDFLTSLEKVDFKAESDDLLSKLLNDYVASTRKILNLIQLASSKTEEFVSNKLELKKFIDWIIGNDFRQARLHDLIGKVSFYQLHKKLVEDVSKEIDSKKINSLNFQLEGITFFSRSMPGLEIHLINVTNECIYKMGVQIQGGDYRHFISRGTAQKPSLIECAHSVKGWMKRIDSEKFKDFEEKLSNNRFGVFNKELFVHLSAHMVDDIKLNEYQDLVKKIAESINSAITKLECQRFRNDFIGQLN